MNDARFLAGTLVLCAALAGCGVSDAEVGNSILKLPECSGKGTAFESLTLDEAKNTYHAAVSEVVNAHVSDLEDINTRPLQCTANDYRGLMKPTAALNAMAAQLPEWGRSRGAALSEADLGPVLLEYLRVYECSLQERSSFLIGFVQDEQSTTETLDSGGEIDVIERSVLATEQQRQRDILNEELLTARPALERTIAFLGAVDRLRPLSAELECLKRASLDLRNAMGLTAEAASCMPKIWDARGSLRDLAE